MDNRRSTRIQAAPCGRKTTGDPAGVLPKAGRRHNIALHFGNRIHPAAHRARLSNTNS
jgi:hypothetical protein